MNKNIFNEINKRNDLLREINILLKEYQNLGGIIPPEFIKKIESYSNMEPTEENNHLLEMERNNLLHLIISTKSNHLISNITDLLKNNNNIDKSTKDSQNKLYVKLIIEIIKEIEETSNINTLDIYYNISYTLYKFLKYNILIDSKEKTLLLETIKSSANLSAIINALIIEDIKTIKKSKYLDKESGEYILLEKLEQNQAALLDENIIKLILNISVSFRENLDKKLLIYISYLNKRNNQNISKLSILERRIDRKEEKTKELKTLTLTTRKKLVSLILSCLLTVGSYFGISNLTRSLISEKIDHKTSNVVSFLLGISTSITIAYTKTFKDYKNYKNLIYNIDDIKIDINNLYYSIKKLKEEIEVDSSLDEEKTKEINSLFNEMFEILGHYYINEEERENTELLKNEKQQTLMLRNKLLNLI